ncbi:ROK family protein [Paenibacillus camerounensis]|uniref:ROK family protein n=1 Tax=Paenibacillus camerounensis TaxID=1243663 RepID=UPI0005AB5F5E|nr:ROK family protein [Paenibacillus camerounensis]
MITHTAPSIKKQVYERIFEHGTVSKADLLQHFAVASSSLTRLLEDMISQGLIIVSGFGSSTGGRKPILFQTNPKHRYLLGLEISRLYSKLGLYDLHLKTLSLTRWEMDTRMTPGRLVELVGEAAETFMDREGITADQLLGIGIGAVGPLDQRNGVILEPELFPSPSWKNVPVCELLTARLGVPARLDNGANTALIGEHWAFREEKVEHALYVHAGVNIRSGLMSGGQIIRGAVDTEGAVGQMIIRTEGPRLRDKGNYGALEAYVSIPSLEERIRSQLAGGRSSLLSGLAPERLTFPALAEALAQGDILVKEQFTETAHYLGIGLANLINTFHPEYVILGGPLVNADPLVFTTAVEVAKKNTYRYPEYSPVFTQGALRDEAVATGAAIMLLHEWQLN